MQQPMIDSYNVRKKEKKENGMWFWERADDLRGGGSSVGRTNVIYIKENNMHNEVEKKAMNMSQEWHNVVE